VISIEYTELGSALDRQLRREQTKAILALMAIVDRSNGIGQRFK
jgi:hypothetical protein